MVGYGSYQVNLLVNLVAPESHDNKACTELLITLSDHYCPASSEIAVSKTFVQIELCLLALHCNFGTILEVMLVTELSVGSIMRLFRGDFW